jgi:two-component system nitrogen regulation sensor histidine kinase NtrY
MASSSRLLGGVAAPAVLLLGVVIVFASIVTLPGLFATKLLVLMAAAALLWAIGWRMRQTNIAIARFLDAISHADLSQEFSHASIGNGFEELGAAMDAVFHRLRQERMAGVAEHQFASALLDGVSAALLAINPDDVVTLVNKASRDLFGDSDGRNVGEFTRYGADFAAGLTRAAPGTRSTCRLLLDGLPQRAILTSAAVDRQGRTWRAVSVQIIQGELEAAELATQVDLVRVLTHEIMNSMTPVASLAASAATLIAAVQQGAADALADARLAIDTLARRAEGINRFVDGYRAFSQSPSISISRFAARPWLDDIVRSFTAGEHGKGIQLHTDVAPPTLHIDADADLLGQVVLNILKNGAEAAGEHSSSPKVTVSIAFDRLRRIRILVSDNGPGVPLLIRSDIFLPFFTTKRAGMGVGLSFARQIVLLHQGVIGIVETEAGTSFEITL